MSDPLVSTRLSARLTAKFSTYNANLSPFAESNPEDSRESLQGRARATASDNRRESGGLEINTHSNFVEGENDAGIAKWVRSAAGGNPKSMRDHGRRRTAKGANRGDNGDDRQNGLRTGGSLVTQEPSPWMKKHGRIRRTLDDLKVDFRKSMDAQGLSTHFFLISS